MKLVILKVSLCLMVLLMAFSVMPSSGNVSASVQERSTVVENEAPKCWALDFVLLVDQSTSMWKEENNNKANDPENYRYMAAQDILDRLILNRLEECPLAVHRFGLIEFGDVPNNQINLIKIDLSSENDRNEWSKDYIQKIAEAKSDQGQNGTDFRAALMQARLMFDNASILEDPDGYGPRRQVVVLLTDGQPTTEYIVNRTGLPATYDNWKNGTGSIHPVGIGEDKGPYMGRMAEDLQDPFWANYYFYVLALNSDVSYLNESGYGNQSIGDNLTSMTTAHKGRLYDLAYNEQAIVAFMNDIVDELFGRPGEIIRCDTPFSVPPYLQEVQFVFFRKEGSTNEIVLTKIDDVTGDPVYEIVGEMEKLVPDAQTLAGMHFEPGKFISTSIKTQYTFAQPLPGKWKFSVSGWDLNECAARIEARKVPMVADVVLENPGATTYYPLQSEAPFYYDANDLYSVRVQTKDRQPIAQNPNFPLTVKATITLPSGAQVLPDGTNLVGINLLETSPGIWSSVGFPVVTPEVADQSPYYKVEITGTAPNPAGGDTVLFTYTSEYRVRKLNHFAFDLISPSIDAKGSAYLACNSIVEDKKVGIPIEVRVKLTQAGSTEGVDQFITSADKSKAFKASLLDSGEGAITTSDGKPVDVYLQPTNARGEFTGILLANQAGLVGCGDVKLRVEFQGSYDVNYNAMPTTTRTWNLKRLEGEGVKWKIISPLAAEGDPKVNLPLHPTFKDCCAGNQGIQPIEVVYKLQDLEGNYLDPAKVSSDPTHLFEFAVNGPKSSTATLVVSVDENDGWLLKAEENPEKPKLTFPGDYTIAIRPALDKFNEGFVPVSQEEPLRLSRTDSFFTSAQTCSTLKIILAIFSVALFGGIVYSVTGGPGGSVEILQSGSSNNVKAVLRLKKMRIVRKGSSDSLKACDIKKIEYRKVKPAMADRAAHIKITDTMENTIFDSDLDVDEIYPLTTEFDVVYR